MARPASGEGIRVYANDVLDDLLAEAEPSASSLPEHEFSETDPEECTTSEPPRSALPELSGSRQSQRPVSFWERNSLTPDAGERATLSSGRKMSERQIAQLKVREAELARVNEEFERNQHQMMDRNRKRREARFEKMYTTMLDGMGGSGVLGDIDQHLIRREEAKARKRNGLHAEWTDKVFNTMQARLQGSVDRRTPRDVSTRLRHQLDEYLKVTNEKVGVYRDIIIEADYNPLRPRGTAIRVATSDLEDPLKRDVLKVHKERMELGLVDMLKGDTAGKQTFPCEWWDKTHATPYGYDVNQDGTLKEFREDALAAKNKTSRVPFDHYNVATGRTVPDQEWGPSGTKYAPGPDVVRNRQGLFETLHQTSNPYRDGRTLDDIWLEAKGKKMPPGPEQRRGRPDLFETFQMKSDPYEDGRSLGDGWLEAKGKRQVPGPEMRRGRQNLFETFQMRSDPYVDGRTLGDQWLEAKGKGFPMDSSAQVKNTPKFGQTLSHTVKEIHDEQRKRRVIPPPPGKIGTLLYHTAKCERDWPVKDRRTASSVCFGE